MASQHAGCYGMLLAIAIPNQQLHLYAALMQMHAVQTNQHKYALLEVCLSRVTGSTAVMPKMARVRTRLVHKPHRCRLQRLCQLAAYMHACTCCSHACMKVAHRK
eukprot:364671-Chlamydomonas_euryale.AAC.10